jgi:pilus assembly protein Flp/PilA
VVLRLRLKSKRIHPPRFTAQNQYDSGFHAPVRAERATNHHKEKSEMTNRILNCLTRLHKDEAGQGIVEYMLIIALVAFAATAGMSSLASGVNSAMTKIGSILGVYIS